MPLPRYPHSLSLSLTHTLGPSAFECLLLILYVVLHTLYCTKGYIPLCNPTDLTELLFLFALLHLQGIIQLWLTLLANLAHVLRPPCSGIYPSPPPPPCHLSQFEHLTYLYFSYQNCQHCQLVYCISVSVSVSVSISISVASSAQSGHITNTSLEGSVMNEGLHFLSL